jgi:hypothetical protein
MKKQKIKRPEFLEVRGSRFLFYGVPLSWTETRDHGLCCDKCQQPLVILFAARELVWVNKDNPRWWVPTGATSACLLPRSVPLREMPRRPHGPKRDTWQLELLPKEAGQDSQLAASANNQEQLCQKL